jgi:hypothetical protein
MVRMVSSSPAVGPGPLISRGFIERRIFRSSMASGTEVLSFNVRSVSKISCGDPADEAATKTLDRL